MGRPKANSVKIQATVSGYSAWAFAELVKAKGQQPADVGRYVIERWFDDNAKYLGDLGITREGFQRSTHGAEVVTLPVRGKVNKDT